MTPDDGPEPESEPARLRRRSPLLLGPDEHEAEAVMLGFGEKLRSRRTSARISQETLAMRSYMGRARLRDMETGKRAPGLLELLVLADRLDVSAAVLTDGLEAPVRRTGTAEVFDLVTRQPGIEPEVIASSLRLPVWYADEIVYYLRSVGAIVRASGGWQSADHGISGCDTQQ
jgi:transcriptional regulator with XRE-family HTH domain